MIALRIALRYLFSKKTHNAVNIISIVAISGVAVATAAIICVLSVFNGFADLAHSRLSKLDPDIKVTAARGKVFEHADSVAALIRSNIPEVAVATPTLSEQAVAIFAGAQMAVNMIGVDADYLRAVGVGQTVIDGQFATALMADNTPVATLAAGTAMRLQAFPGTDRLISLYVPKRTGRINAANALSSFRADSLFVGGVVRMDDSKRDASTIYVPLPMVRNLLEYQDSQASAIEIALSSGADTDRTVDQISRLLGSDYRVSDRLRQEADSFRMIKVEKWITFVMLAFILLIASFNVISTLSMLIIEKRDNMATLRAMGATRQMIRRIFALEGWLICLFGGVIGTIIGIALSLAQQYGGFVKLGADPSQLTISVYPMRVSPADIGMVLLLIIIIGFAVGTITSRFGFSGRP